MTLEYRNFQKSFSMTKSTGKNLEIQTFLMSKTFTFPSQLNKSLELIVVLTYKNKICSLEIIDERKILVK